MLTLQANIEDLSKACDELSSCLQRDFASEMLADIKQRVQDKYRLEATTFDLQLTKCSPYFVVGA